MKGLKKIKIELVMMGTDRETEISDMYGNVLKTISSPKLGRRFLNSKPGDYVFDGRYIYDPHYTTGPRMVVDTDSAEVR